MDDRGAHVLAASEGLLTPLYNASNLYKPVYGLVSRGLGRGDGAWALISGRCCCGARNSAWSFSDSLRTRAWPLPELNQKGTDIWCESRLIVGGGLYAEGREYF